MFQNHPIFISNPKSIPKASHIYFESQKHSKTIPYTFRIPMLFQIHPIYISNLNVIPKSSHIMSILDPNVVSKSFHIHFESQQYSKITLYPFRIPKLSQNYPTSILDHNGRSKSSHCHSKLFRYTC